MLASLSSRLKLGIGAILVAFSVAGAASIAGVLAAARDVGTVVDRSGPMIGAIDGMESSVLKQDLYAMAYAATDGQSGLTELVSERRAFDAARAELAILRGASDRGAMAVEAEYRDYVALTDELVDAVDGRHQAGRKAIAREGVPAPARSAAELQDRLAKARTALVADLDGKVKGPLYAALDADKSRATDAAWRSLYVFGVLILVAAAFAVLVGVMLTRGFRGPIARLVDATERIASGDRGARLEDVGIEEFRELESSFNDMAERLDEAEQGLVRSYEGQRKILDEIPVGLLTIGADFRIGPEYSAATDEIFSKESVVGMTLVELLYPADSKPASEGTAKGAKELERYLKQLFENTTADKDFLDDINPVRDLVIEAREGPKSLGITFTRVYEGEKVTDVLVRIADRTEVIVAEQALEEERRSHKRDADSIQAILSIGPGPLKDFFSETRETLVAVRGKLAGLEDREAVNACFRSLHSIKGAAGSFGIEAIAMTAHEAEDIFAALRAEGRAPSTAELVRVNVLLGTIGEELDAFEDLVRRLKATLSRLEARDAEGAEMSELEEFVESLGPMVGQLERSLVKPMELVTELRTEAIPHFREMRTVIIHLIRNAADHGLEDEYERLFQGKPKRGKIKLSIRPKDEGGGAYLVEVEDDGQGLNFDRIAEKGAEMGLIPPQRGARPDKERLLALLFSPGFSTKDKVDEISGRGVGLDLVRDIVKSVGGSISVGSARGRGTRFSVTIPA